LILIQLLNIFVAMELC